MKSSNPEIEAFLVVATAHVVQSDITLLDADAARTAVDPLNPVNEGGCIITWKHLTGYILHVDEPDTDEGDYTELFECAIDHGYSGHLVRLMQLAQMHKCVKLILDSYGPTYDDLPRFDR
ncbi:MAG: hypothetical protein ABSD28_14225 [Tepidisphaeraceae bacterium]|jgi:hypothetical protein